MDARRRSSNRSSPMRQNALRFCPCGTSLLALAALHANLSYRSPGFHLSRQRLPTYVLHACVRVALAKGAFAFKPLSPTALPNNARQWPDVWASEGTFGPPRSIVWSVNARRSVYLSMLTTVAICTFNRAASLRRTLEALVAI